MLPGLGFTRGVLDRARRSRDARFDGKFFIAVTSTRIYCRPICPSRTPKDANVHFYLTAAEAAAAGFRPCLRCRPEVAPGSPAWLGTSAIVQRALRLIQDGALDEGSIERLAARLGMGSRHLRRLFVRHVGASPIAVAQTRRLHFAKQLLDETRLPITEIALAAGFGSIRRFNTVFKAIYLRPPREFRRHHQAGGSDAAEITLRLHYRPPYDWHALQRFLARRAVRGVEHTTADYYARTVRTSTGVAILRVRPLAAVDALELRVRGCESRELLAMCASVRRMFDLTADPARIMATFKGDAQLRPLIERRPGLRIPATWDAFESGVRAIVGQQVSVRAATTILGRLVERCGERAGSDPDGLTHLFPTPAALAHADLDGIGLTRRRIATLQGFARAVHGGDIPFGESSERVVAALATIEGIGVWTAGYMALRGLGDPDAFPDGDLVLRRRLAVAGRPCSTQELRDIAESWRPFRGYAVLHLWQSDTDGSPMRQPRPVPVPAPAPTIARASMSQPGS